MSEFKSSILDTNLTFDENAYREAAAKLRQTGPLVSASAHVVPTPTSTTSKKTPVDNLLEDEEYEITDDEDDSQSKQSSDKENKTDIVKFNPSASESLRAPSAQNISNISPIKRTPTKRFCSHIENTLLGNVDTLENSPKKIFKSDSVNILLTDDASTQAENHTSTQAPISNKTRTFDP